MSRYRKMPYPTAKARVWFDWMLSEIEAGRPVRVCDVGTFSRGTRKARRIRNPATGQLMELGETVTVKFTAAKQAKERMKRCNH